MKTYTSKISYKHENNKYIFRWNEKAPEEIQNKEENEIKEKENQKQEKPSLEEYTQKRQSALNETPKEQMSAKDQKFLDSFPPKDGSPDDPWKSVFGNDNRMSGGNEIETNEAFDREFKNTGAEKFIKNPEESIEEPEEESATNQNIQATDGKESFNTDSDFDATENIDSEIKEQKEDMIETIKGHSEKISENTDIS